MENKKVTSRLHIRYKQFLSEHTQIRYIPHLTLRKCYKGMHKLITKYSYTLYRPINNNLLIPLFHEIV